MIQQINLINPAFRKQRELFTAVMLAQAMVALVLGMGGWYGYQYNEAERLDKQIKAAVANLVAEQARLDKVTAEHAPRQKDASLEKRTQDMELQLKGEEAVLAELKGGGLGNTQGYSGYMRAFARQSVSGLWLTEFGIKGAGKEMLLGGRALRPELVPAYIKHLNTEDATRGRVFSALEMQRPKAGGDTSQDYGRLNPVEVRRGESRDKAQTGLDYIEFKLYSSATEGA